MNEPDRAATGYTLAEAEAVLQGLAATGAPMSASAEISYGAPPTLPMAAEPLPPRPVAGSLLEETYRALLESLPDAMVVIDGGGAIVLVNQQTERLFGYRRDELLGHSIEILVPERHRAVHVEHRRHYFANPHTRAMGAMRALFGRRKDGSLFPVEISLGPIRTEQGMLATSVIRDVSQREREAAKFRTLIENIPAVTFIAPLDESVPELYVSPQIEALLGFTSKEWIEDPVLWHRQLHPEDRERWNKQFAPTCASGTPFNSIYRFLAKDGHTVWVHGSARMVRDGEGKLLFLQGVAFDVTPIKEAEQALQRSNAELDRLVEERTRELKDKAEELKEFAFRASHDLKEPLRSLRNYPDLLAKNYGGKIDEQFEKGINRTLDAVKRFSVLFDAIKVYSEYLQKDREPQPTDCGAVAEGACMNLQAAIEESGADVSLGALPTVLGNLLSSSCCSRICSPMPSNIGTMIGPCASRSAPGRATMFGCSGCATTASASSRSIWNASSSWGSVCIPRRRNITGPAMASPSASGSSRATAAVSGPSRTSGRAALSSSRCPSRQRTQQHREERGRNLARVERIRCRPGSYWLAQAR